LTAVRCETFIYFVICYSCTDL